MKIDTKDEIVLAVLKKMDQRSIIGQEKYGATMMQEIVGQEKDLNRFLIENKELENLNIFDLIRQWAKDKGIYKSGDARTQYVKLMEEAGELAKALLNNDKAEIVDAIGDIAVVLTNLAELEGLKIEDCIDTAYNVIARRKGKMINGTFVKQTL